MATKCKCGEPNTGRETCPMPEHAVKAAYLVKLVDDDGNRNGYTIATLLNETKLSELINDPDPSKRWYPLTDIDNIVTTVTPPTSSTGQFGAKRYAIKKQVEDTEFTVFGRSRADAALWNEGFGCGAWGVYEVDMDKQIYGTFSDDFTIIYPERIATGSFLATYYKVNPAANEPQKVVVQYTRDMNNDDSMSTIMEGVTADILGAQGLRVLEFDAVTNITATGFRVKVYEKSNSAVRVKKTGLVQANFSLKNATTNATIAFTGFSESADGEYTFTHASQTTGVKAIPSFSRIGYSGSKLSDQTITY